MFLRRLVPFPPSSSTSRLASTFALCLATFPVIIFRILISNLFGVQESRKRNSFPTCPSTARRISLLLRHSVESALEDQTTASFLFYVFAIAVLMLFLVPWLFSER